MEIWKDVVGYEGFYQVSNLGNVKSIERTSINAGSYSGYINTKTKYLKKIKNKYGYECVVLTKNRKRTSFSVHRLVAVAFLPQVENKNEVNHIDRNKSNNQLSNLEWCNRSENIRHYYDSINTSSKYTGVSYQKDRKKWISYVDVNGVRITLGRFDTELIAYETRENFIKKTIKKDIVI